MKYGKSLINIKDKLPIKENYIDYNDIKKHIHSPDFFNILKNAITIFDEKYNNMKNKKYKPYDLYCNLLINYLSINKLVKKFKKKNNDAYLLCVKKYVSIENFIRSYSFYSDIMILPEKIKYKNNETCSICLEKCTFPIETSCKHNYCWTCLLDVNKTFDFCPNCRTKTFIDPALIILNSFIRCDKKYSPFKVETTQLDVVSDLHIDQWSDDYKPKYPCGIIKHFPLKFDNIKNEYLIVAGDICDDLNESINYLNKISVHYKKIIFVDGNHEHVNVYPNLYTKDYIANKITNNKIIYLPSKPYIIKNTMFIGCCGWWDYDNQNKKSIKDSSDYFKDWIPHFKETENSEFIHNVMKKADEEYRSMISTLEKYKDDDSIKNIIIVTHTLPDIKYSENKSITDNSASQFNSKMNNLFKYNKISKWIFGHTHCGWEEKKNGIHFICNPRGRPDDHNREKYSVKEISIIQ